MLLFTSLFAGVTKRPVLRFLRSAFAAMKPEANQIVLPCAGAFSEVAAAIDAGYEPGQIFTSDIGVFSSVLGSYFSDTPIAELPFQLSAEMQELYDGCETELDRAALLLWIIKRSQIPPKNAYNAQYRQDLETRREAHVNRLKRCIEKAAQRYGPIHYQIQDVRAIIKTLDNPNAVVMLNPPLYRGGYDKMFATEPDLIWNVQVPQLDWDKEYRALYEQSRASSPLYIWTCSGELPEGLDGDIVFCRQTGKTEYEYLLCTRPAELLSRGVKKRIHYRPAIVPKRVGTLVDPDIVLTPETKIGFIEVDKHVAMYYRDLMAHKMGSTRAEKYYLMTLDSKVFGCVGFMLSKVMRLVQTKTFEVFGFSVPLTRYPGSNRLLMMAITCIEMRSVLTRKIKRNRIFKLDGLRTTCITKYRALKYHRGLFSKRKREKLPNGNYHLTVETEWHNRGFAQVMRDFIAEYGHSQESEDTGGA